MKTFLGELLDVKELNDAHLLLGYEFEDGSKFYCEHSFITQLTNLLNLRKEQKDIILNKMIELVRKNGKTQFVHDYEFPMVVLDGFIMLEIEDILNPLHIFMEDKSRGSDYGD